MLSFLARHQRQGSWGYNAAAAAATLSTLAFGLSQTTTSHADAAAQSALNPKEFIPLKIIDKQQLTPNTFQYRFELPADKTAGMNLTSCIVTRAMLPDGPDDKPKAMVRPYTPTSSCDAKGYMDLVVKVYPNGKLSKHIGSLEVGDTLDVKGPIPKLKYSPNMVKHIACIAGGSGITPMIQVIEGILSNPEDKTQVSLMFANNTEADIILKDRLDRLAANYPGRFKICYFIADGKYTGTLQPGIVKRVGFVSKDSIRSFIPGPQEDVMVLVCGPPGMMNAISGNKAPDYTQGELSGALAALGYNKSQVFKF